MRDTYENSEIKYGRIRGEGRSISSHFSLGAVYVNSRQTLALLRRIRDRKPDAIRLRNACPKETRARENEDTAVKMDKGKDSRRATSSTKRARDASVCSLVYVRFTGRAKKISGIRRRK